MMLHAIWDDFLKIVREEVGSRVVETWLKAVSLHQWDQETQTMYVQAPNAFVKEWIQNRYMSLFRTHLGRLLHVTEPKMIFFSSIDSKSHVNGSHASLIVPARRALIAPQIKKNFVPRQIGEQQTRLNGNYTFDTFVEGPNSSLACAAARAVSESPGKIYNPLFIYGGPGLGKTHLLHAIGNTIQAKNESMVILYQTADRFVNEFIGSIRFNKVHTFQEKYRLVDLLLIDDIQFISNKDQTQEAFFHIFNSLYDSKKQIVFTSDVFPRDIKGVAERLRSRLEWGLVTDVHKPPFETKVTILQKKAHAQGEQLSNELAEYIAQQVQSVRELEGALIRVLAFASLTKQQPSLELAQKILHKKSSFESSQIDFQRIATQVCQHYSYKLSDLRSNNRAKQISLVRQITMYLMKKMTNKSLREIGIFLGRKDHSTVLHAFDKVEQLMQKDTSLKMTIKQLEENIL